VGAVVTSTAFAADKAHERARPHWDYVEPYGPEHWSDLPGNSLCHAGLYQAPIALESTSATPGEVAAPSFFYAPSHVDMVNTGHTVQLDYDKGSTIHIGMESYRLAQFHFHTPSEHTVDGVRYPMEMHLVHTDASGKPAVVVGILVKEGTSHHSELDSAFEHLPTHSDEHISLPRVNVHAARLLPTERSFFHYMGSLTTPPCTEGIQWYVMRTPIELPAEQIEAYRHLAHLTPSNRPLQDRNARTVTLSEVPEQVRPPPDKPAQAHRPAPRRTDARLP
jgi:carbonic anhydrase